MQIETIERRGPITLFKVHLDDDEITFKVWSIDEEHAIKEAQTIAITANLISISLINSIYK